jgi:hypothetical protein
MKKFTGICLIAMVLSGPAIIPLSSVCAAQDRDRDHRDQDDERGYYNNRYYKQGWKDGEHHKRRHKRWKNDADRRAYEAGYSHGERGERWSGHR